MSKTSASTATIAAAPTVITGPTPTITGTAKVGSKLTAVAGTWQPAPVTNTYKWYSDGALISGATASTYTTKSASLGKSITVRVVGAKSGFTSVGQTSEPVVIASGTFTAGTPKISGTAAVGVTLTAANGTWSPTTSATFTYQWMQKADGAEAATAISGATKSTYAVASAYQGSAISVTVTATRPGFTTESATSAPTAAVLGKLTAPTPKISGTAKVGKTLIAKPGTWTAGTVLSYEWIRTKSGKSKVLSGTAKTYKITSSSKGYTIKVRVTGTLEGYRTVKPTSKATAKIT